MVGYQLDESNLDVGNGWTSSNIHPFQTGYSLEFQVDSSNWNNPFSISGSSKFARIWASGGGSEFQLGGSKGRHPVTLPKTNRSLLQIGLCKRKGSSLNHHFFRCKMTSFSFEGIWSHLLFLSRAHDDSEIILVFGWCMSWKRILKGQMVSKVLIHKLEMTKNGVAIRGPVGIRFYISNPTNFWINSILCFESLTKS